MTVAGPLRTTIASVLVMWSANLRVASVITPQAKSLRPSFVAKVALRLGLWQNDAPIYMKKEPKNKNTEAQLLNLLKEVLPKATKDPKLAGKIYDAIESELKAKTRFQAFEKFCAKVALPNLEPKSIASVKEQLAASFGDGDVTIQPNRKDKSLNVEVSLADGSQFSGAIKVNPNAVIEEDGEQEVTFKFVSFPVNLPGDLELVWSLAKRETMTPDEACIALSQVEEEFWASKTGQKLIRDRVDKSFPEFISRVPAGMLSEVGLKRHYKMAEVLKTHRTLGQRAPKSSKNTEPARV